MAGLRHPRQQTTDRRTGSLALSAPAGPGGDVVDRLLVSVFFGQRYAAARRRLRHPQRRMPPATGVGRLRAR